jgi:DNA-binding NarL/FixJ family response regulator
VPEIRLSQRELQILKLLGQGKSVNEIADELFLNNRTISTYKARLMQKMNFKNNAELVLYASESGLI